MPDALHLRWSRASNGYQLIFPTDDEVEIWRQKHKKIRSNTIYAGIGGPEPRLVPRGKPVSYQLETKGAIEALKLALNCQTKPMKTLDFYNEYGPLSLTNWEQGDTQREWLRFVVNLSWLSRLVEIQDYTKLISTFDINNVGTSRVKLYKPPGKETPLLRLEPRSLGSMIHLALATTIAGNSIFRSCVVCGTPMIVGGIYGDRASKQTCSQACIQQRYRIQKKRNVLNPSS